MGHHYVPQYYLRGFAEDDDNEMIWMYDKQRGTYRLLPIKAVAQSGDFYTQEAEDFLNRYIETPARKPFEQMERGERVDRVDRLIIAIYIQMAVLRVPRTRKILLDMVQNGVADFVKEIKADPNEIPSSMSQSEFFALLDSWQAGVIDDGPSEAPMRTPWIQQELVEMIYAMTWRIITLDEANEFITSDNPVFITESSGLMHPDGEIGFPISSKSALHASWRGQSAGLVFIQGSKHMAGEINRRTASVAERFIFAGDGDLDVKEFVGKPSPLLYPFPW